MMKNRYQNVDALRFIFAIIIVYFHVLHSNIIPFVGASEKIYTNLAVNCANAGWIVECFFIVGGAFLYKTYVSNPKLTVTEFFCRKVIRLWPVLFFSIILAVLTGRNNIYVGLFNALFLQCTGLSFAYKGIVWYVSPFFWVSVFLFTILRKCKREVVQVVLPLMVYFSYVVNINYSEGAFGRETIFFFLNLGMLRAIAGLGLGCILEELILKVNGIK